MYGTEEDPLLYIAPMEGDAFIANCVSVFSAVAKERDYLWKDRHLGLSAIDNEFICPSAVFASYV